MEDGGTACWLSSHGLLSLLFYRAQHHPPRVGSAHSGLDPSTSTIKGDTAITDKPTGHLMEAAPLK